MSIKLVNPSKVRVNHFPEKSVVYIEQNNLKIFSCNFEKFPSFMKNTIDVENMYFFVLISYLFIHCEIL